MTRDYSNAVAIVGMAGRFPGSRNLREFWQKLCDGIESIRRFRPEELREAGVPESMAGDPGYVPAAGYLDGIEWFDADFFAMPPREAETTDPQHRLLLECAWEALEDAGCVADTFPGGIAVFAGAGQSTYLIRNLLANETWMRSASELNVLLGTNKDFAPLRISHKLRLTGPSVNVNTACSTGLVAVHMACQSLLGYQCDLALAGAAGIQVPQAGYLYQSNGIGSPDGHCRAFDAQAAGTVHGNGAGMVALKRMEDAIAAGDPIHAVILGSAINNDGGDKAGFTAPSVEGQSRVVAEALAVARCEPESIGYVETHGTGTPVGDPVEIAALTRAFGGSRKRGFCAIGSVKTNIGHLDEAAGIAGLIKTALALKHRRIPPSLHYRAPNPDIDFTQSPFFVNTQSLDWPGGAPGRAGVSSFGIGGTNAHVVLEEAPETSSSASSEWQLLPLSARTGSALQQTARRLAGSMPDDLAGTAYTLQRGRTAFPHRQAVVCRDREEALRALSGQLPWHVVSGAATGNRPRIAFAFSGQGSQYPGMGAGLYASQPVFRKEFDLCADLVRGRLGCDMRANPGEAELRRTAIAQPMLFAFEYALAKLWMSYGIEPSCLAGHSVGEYVAAHLAGVFSLEDALTLVVERGRLMQQMPEGAMLSVRVEEARLQKELNPALTIAVRNAPDLFVVAGERAGIGSLAARLSAQGIACQPVPVSHAFHSPMMEAAVAPFTAFASRIPMAAPTIAWVSNVSGTWIAAQEATDPRYYGRHLREPVRFAECLAVLAADRDTILLEVGPGQAIAGMARRHPAWNGRRVVASGGASGRGLPEEAAFLLAAGQLWADGAPLDWSRFHPNERRRKLSLPTYPFERKRYWVDPPARAAAPASPIDDWFYVPEWPEAEAVEPAPRKPDWLLVGASGARSEAIEDALRRTSGRVVRRTLEDSSPLPTPMDRVLFLPDRTERCDLAPLLSFAQALMRADSLGTRLYLLTENGCAARACDPVDPAQAALIGATQTIPLETSLPLRCVDIAADVPAEAIARELNSDAADSLIALRGETRYRRSLVPRAMPALDPARVLKQGGVYLITGGLGSMGLAFAEFLARQVKAKLVLVGRTPLTAPTAAGIAQQIGVRQGPPPLPDEVVRDLNRLCAAAVADYLRTASTLEPLAIKPGYRRFLQYLISIVDEHGFQNSAPPAAELFREARAKHPRMRGAIRLLERCTGLYPSILSGAVPGNHALYPDGSADFLRQCSEDTVGYGSSKVWLKAASEFVRSLARRPLAILEVGGGNGDLTAEMAAELDGCGVSYHFTDISQAFVTQAERAAEARGYEWMKFGTLDIARDPAAQGFAPRTYDVIVAYNVVHVSPRIVESLRHLRSLLKPGGHLVLVESQSIHHWDLACWGVAEDLWAFEDDERRGGHPLLSGEAWRTAVLDAGFELGVALPDAAAGSDTTLVIARVAGSAERLERVQQLEQLGAEVLVCTADVADREAMERVCRLARERFGPIDGVIHTAGELRPGLIASKRPGPVEAVLRPKVDALAWIAEFCDLPKLDFLILCSSAAALAPIAGQFDYAAANAYMDAFAHRQVRQGVRAVSINWNFWQQAGMMRQALSSAAVDELEAGIRARHWTGAGVDAFARILSGLAAPQIAISPEPLRLDQPNRLGHPLVQRRGAASGQAIAYTAEVSAATHWEVGEHRPGGAPVLPGTAYLEIALTAFHFATGNETAELSEVYFLTPMVFDERNAREVRTVIERDGDGYRFLILSREGSGGDEWVEHATGGIRSLSPSAAPREAGSLAVSERVDFLAQPDHPLARRQRGFPLHWRCWTGLEAGESGLSARVALPAGLRGERTLYRLHPGLLDLIVGASAMYRGFEDGLPFSYGRVRVYRRLPAACVAECRYRAPASDSFHIDLQVRDPEGAVCLDIENYSMRRLRAEPGVAPAAEENYELVLPATGSLERLALQPVPRREPGPGQVEIEVAMAGLNFIEVLFALGMLPQFESALPARFGLECAGRVSRTGPAVTRFQPGDEVIAFCASSFSRYTVADERVVVRKPSNLDVAAAATVPAAFCTAYHALIGKAALRPGERVLIHSAAGGVGLAAVHIAQWVGATVFATAGNEEKRARLRSAGVAHVMDSRTLDFADRIRTVTGGRGVDVVLNSLTGEFFTRSLACLAPYGRFVEIGKREFASGRPLDLSPFAKRLSFFAVDVGTDLPGFEELFQQVAAHLEAGHFEPLPYTVFPLGSVREAFEYMAQARHFGKIVIDVQSLGRGHSKPAGRSLAAIAGAGAGSSQSLSTHARPNLSTSFVAPAAGPEAVVASIWEDLLGVSPVGALDNFFELRGDSLLAAQVTSRLGRELNVNVPLSAVLERPTVADFAAFLERRLSAAQALATPAGALRETEEQGEI